MRTRYLVVAGTGIILLLSFRYLLPLTMPFVLAYFFAGLVLPIIRFLVNKMKWNRRVSILLVVLVILLVLGGFTVYMISLIISQGLLFLQKLPVYQQMIANMLERMCCHCDRMLELSTGTSYHYVESQVSHLYYSVGTNILPKFSGYVTEIFRWLMTAFGSIFIFFLSTVLILFDEEFPRIRGRLKPFVKRLKSAGFAYMKAQFILIFIIAALLSFGLFLMGSDYALLLGTGIALMDAFPVLGSGLLLIPWAILNIVSGHYYDAAILVTLFCVVTFLREILEPRLIGKEVGLKPLLILLAVYVGVQLFGISGVVLGPVLLTVLKAVDEEMKNRKKD